MSAYDAPDLRASLPGRTMLLPPFGGVSLAFLSYAAFSLSDASVKLLEGEINPFQLAFAGAVLGFVILPFIREAGQSYMDVFRTKRHSLWLARAVATSVSTVCSVIAFTRLPMPEAFALIFLMPIFITILSVLLLREEVGPWRWAAVFIGFLGVLIVLRPGIRELNGGHAAALAAGLSSAIPVILFRMAGAGESRLSLYGAGLFGPLLVNGLLMLGSISLPNPRQLAFMLSYGLLAAIGQALLMLSVRSSPASKIAPIQYSQMIWAVALSYLLFDQPLDRVTVIGILIIIGAGLLTWARERIKLPLWKRRFPLRPR